MGCSTDDRKYVGTTLPLEEVMEGQKRNLNIQIEENNIKIMSYEKEIENYNNKIKDGENEIKLNSFALSEAEVNTKIKKLMELQKDRARIQGTLKYLQTLNETLKNNLENVKKKLDEYRAGKVLRDGNEIMNKIELVNNAKVINANAKNLIKQKEVDEQNQKNIQRLNDAYAGSDVINEDEHRRQLLGK